MGTKVIVSYDGTGSDRDALSFGRLLAGAGASLELAYVRHAAEAESTRERLAESEARALLAAGAEEAGDPDLPTHIVLSGSTPAGLRDLAVRTEADMIVFGSEYRTARGHIDPQASARRLLDGGPIALGLATAGLHDATDFTVRSIGAIGEDGDPCVLETAEALASKLGAEVASRASADVDLIVVGSKPGTVNGRVRISAAAEYLIELARCPVVVLPRGVALGFE
ncbi:MAG TPA: universal stress protein [Gaiellaceae bacterium]|nr:universal stress protein [Gaiellaceae bacterium]